MKNKTAKQIVTGYRLKCALVAVLYACALLALILFVMRINILVAMIGVVALAYTLHTPFEKIRQKDIDSIIYEELDPERFEEILSLGVLKKSDRHKVLLYMAKGDHDALLDLVERTDAKITNPIDKCNNLYRKGYVYFERGEYEKLPEIVKKYERIKADNPKYLDAVGTFSVFDKFDAFADDDFEYVVDVCDIDLKELDPKKQNHKLTKINVSFYRAVSLYKLGKMEEAKAAFEEIITFAPKMHKAKLSREFIDLIENQ